MRCASAHLARREGPEHLDRYRRATWLMHRIVGKIGTEVVERTESVGVEDGAYGHENRKVIGVLKRVGERGACLGGANFAKSMARRHAHGLDRAFPPKLDEGGDCWLVSSSTQGSYLFGERVEIPDRLDGDTTHPSLFVSLLCRQVGPGCVIHQHPLRKLLPKELGVLELLQQSGRVVHWSRPAVDPSGSPGRTSATMLSRSG